MSHAPDHSSEQRQRQEREIALDHALVSTEYALAQEAAVVGLALERAGIVFDPATFIALRILEGGRDERLDPSCCLDEMIQQGVLDRCVALTFELLEQAA
jgi:hypothetical protein